MRTLDDETMVSTARVSHLLGVTPRTVYRLANDGEFRIYKIGRVFRVPLADIETFLARSQIPPGGLDHLIDGESDADRRTS